MKNTNWQFILWWLLVIIGWTTIILVVYEQYSLAWAFGGATLFLLIVLVVWGLIYSSKDKKNFDQLFKDKLK